MKKGQSITEEQEKKYKKISTIIVIAVVVIGLLISCDVLLVTKAGVGPFLAVRTKVYNDGGTKEYYGIGYKVIKYHQKVGRRDTVLGGWNLKYSIEPTKITSMDLAIEFRNYPKKTYKKLYGQFLKITGKVASVDSKKNKITLRYTDEDGGKYTLDIECLMAEKNKDLDTYTAGDDMEIIGTLKDYTSQDPNAVAKVVMENCFK